MKQRHVDDRCDRGGPGALAVTGSKGGVGKSTLTTNLAVALGRWGRRVMLVDGDLGLANLDVLLGLLPKRTVEHVIRGESTLDEVMLPGPPGVRLLPAASGIPELSSIDGEQRLRLLASLQRGSENVDDLIVDTGAGLGGTTLSLQLAADRVLLVTTPEPTSLVDAYASLKVLWLADPHKPVDIVVNNADDEEQADRAFEQIARAAEHFMGRRPGWMGAIARDPLVVDAVRRQQPLLQLHPHAPSARDYERIAMRLTLDGSTPAGDLDYWDRLVPSLDFNEELSH